MSKLFEPEVYGKGISIRKAPTLPNHGVRKKDLEAHVRIVKYEIDGVTSLEIDKLAADYFIQCFDVDGETVWPNSETPSETKIVVDFLFPQSGEVRVLFIGGTSGD
jgi:hypothetical protein